jgi:hypothetical protein
MKPSLRSILILAGFAIVTAMPCHAAPELSIDDIAVAESAGNAVFTVSLSAAVAAEVTVDWATQDGTAAEPGDYPASTATITFPPNVQTRTISVPIINDTEGELAETFSVVLSNPSANAEIADAQGEATIGESDITLLSWDPGTADLGSVVQTGTATPVSRRYFKINAQGLAVGAWRTALRVTAGEANLYAGRTQLPVPGSAEWSSERAGSDGWVLRPDQFNEGETWYFLVDITTAATWRLYTGDVFVQPLGTLKYTDTNGNGNYNIGDPALPAGEPVLPSGSGAVTVGPEGMRFFTGDAPSGTPGWSLWLNGDTRDLAVRQTGVPFHDPSHYDHKQAGAMLLVPDYLGSNSAYFFSVIGNPGDSVNLDSRIQAVTHVDFNTTQSNVNVTTAPFRVYRVEVPIDQIAWDVSTTAVSGDPNVSVRRDNLPSQWFNDAFSEVAGLATDSVTLVPQFLTDDIWFITVYGTGTYQFTLRNGPPVVTPMNYVDTKPNDPPNRNRAGWRFYAVSDIELQKGSLGWELALANQVPGTEIAIRRNAVPGRWNYRNAFDGAGTGNPGYVDLASDSGLLQQPGHQADIWYVGIYQPNAPLGAFTLEASKIQPAPVAFNNGSAAVTDQLRNAWSWFRIDVPAGVLGWDLRLRDITGGNPQMVVARDLLPATVGTWPWLYPNHGSEWPSGYGWAQYADWSGRVLNADESSVAYRRWVAATDRPLEPGTYYVGVYNADAANPAAYTLVSRGIGAGMIYPVVDLLPPVGGTKPVSNLAPREAAYFKVNLPAGSRSWEFTLDPTVGEMLLMVRRGALPDPDTAGWTQPDGSRQVRVQKPGPERYVILPPDNTDFLIAGDYYLAVVSEGQNPADTGHTGSGNCSGTLTSRGSLVVPNLGAVSGAGPSQAVTLVSGQMKGYHFTVPVGTQALEMRLNNRVGNPQMSVVSGTRLPQSMGLYGYGGEGGQSSGTPSLTYDDNLITIANPAPGDYTVTVNAAYDNDSTSYAPASATLLIQAVVPTPVDFNGGTSPVIGQQAQSWKFFRIEVPAGPLGWDLRLRDISGGNPQMVVTRVSLPASVATWPWTHPNHATGWPDNYSWAQATDWTGRWLNADETAVGYRRFVAAMDRPLKAGIYYVGVHNADSTTATSYTVDSRGIGAGMIYPVVDLLPPVGGTKPVSNLAPREAAYFKVNLPAGSRSWEFTLDPTLGELLLMVRRGQIPDPETHDWTQSESSRQVRVQKAGPERYVILPPDNTDFLLAGDYYLAVVSEGQNPADTGHTGSGNCSGTLTSRGSLMVDHLGVANGPGLSRAVTLAGAQMKAYRFSVPPNTATLEMRLNNRVGNPRMAVVGGLRLPLGNGLHGYGGEGGQTSGSPAVLADGELITVANPPAGDYSVMVSAAYDDSTQSWLPASATLLVQAVEPTLVFFNGGTATVTGQQALSWRYFRIEVPEGPLGWDLRLRDVTGGAPQLVVARGALPGSVSTWPWQHPNHATEWPDGHSWTQYSDWTGRVSNPDETFVGYRRFVAAMGRPLVKGTYFVGVYNADAANEAEYTVDSRGIGPLMIYPVVDLLPAAGSTVPVSNLAPREAAYFKVNVLAGTPSWEITLDPTVGEMLLAVRRGAIPDPDYTDATQSEASRQVRVQKVGPERYVILPPDNTAALAAGNYYLAVVSEGQGPVDTGHTGTGDCTGTLTSRGSLAHPHLGIASEVGLNQAVSLTGAQMKSYHFRVPVATAALELRLENRVGNPQMALVGGLGLPLGAGLAGYGGEGGQTSGTPSLVADDDLLTIADPPPGEYTVTLSAAYDGTTQSWPPATADLLIRRRPLLPLNFAASLNGNGQSNTDTRQVISGERTAYAVDVPVTLAGQPVLGWKLDLTTAQGTAILRVYKNLGNTAPDAMITVTQRTAILVPPWLTLGNTWYVEIEAQGFTEYTLTSSPVELDHNPWSMPVTFNQNFADSGVQNNGNPLPGDQGTDLAQNDWHFYAIDVPVGNGGLLRTQLQAISGNPDLYLREDGVPTTHHYSHGSLGQPLVDRSLTGTTTEYGNWVPLDGRTEIQLRPGRWYLGVNAAGTSNVRYRLKASTGSVTDLSLNQAPVAGQTMVGGDWRYYRFTIPVNAPSQWRLTFSQQLGDVVMWIRDTIPPGDGANSAASGRIDWGTDHKNQGPYPSYDPAGTHTLAVPQLRPGHTYFAGFLANGDATFTLSSSTVGGTIGSFPALDFYNGRFTDNIPAGGSTVVTVTAPPDATRWKHTSTHSSGIEIRIEQGSLTPETGPVHYSSGGAVDSSLNQPLTAWPWVPGPVYYIRFVNPTGAALPIDFQMGGRNATNEDEDHDGLPDVWEIAVFGGIWLHDGDDDPDFDDLPNLIEFAFGLDPNSGVSRQLPQAQVIGGNLVITFTQPAGTTIITYGAEQSPSMAPGSWLPVPDTGGGGLHTFSVPRAGHPRMFMRLVVTSP